MAKAAGGKGKRGRKTGAKQAAGKIRQRAKPMRQSAASRTRDQSGWNPGKYALWSQRWGNPNDDSQTFPTTVLLRHPTAPFTRNIGTLDNLESDLKKIAYDYLVAASESSLVDPPLQLPSEWLAALSGKSSDPTFGWLPIGWPTTNSTVNSLVSFLTLRSNASDGSSDQMAVMLASQPTGPGFGLRVVAHVRKSRSQSGSPFEISISGMTACLPFGRHRPASHPRSVTRAAASPVREADAPVTSSAFIDFLTSFEIKDAMAAPLGLDTGSVFIRGMRIPPGNIEMLPERFQVEYNVTGRSKDGRNSTPYAFIYAANFTRVKDKRSILSPPALSGPPALISKIELVADAWQPTPGYARVFPRDPASQPDPGSPGGAGQVHRRRPTRSEQDLDQFRCEEEITPGETEPLEFPPPPTDPEDAMVMLCPGFVLEDPAGSNAVKQVDLPDTGPDKPFVRSNDFSAVNAHKNVRQFFLRLEAYGILPSLYFRIAKLPLKLFYRSGIRPGPGKDGQTVNARVLAEGFSVNFEGPTRPDQRPGLEMHLGLADLSTRRRSPWNGKDRSPAEPLGIAADARWIWHEIGHVLLMASVGELQFRFAHSPGDALAAIVSDPRSTLATSTNWRGATFPWVFLPRRHDRCVAHGWGWGGGLHYALAQVQDSAKPRRKAYWSEQILSSSLFRLYRCIGGDTTQVGSLDQPDVNVRESASHYSVYLIMRGIQILGTSIVVPANEPDQLVSTLIDADINTGAWDVVFTPEVSDDPPVTPLDLHRIGGCVHKVIRWAFEAQGLYTPTGTITNAPGTPPPVDIYIADRRPTVDANALSGDVDYGYGSYNPVSLDWDLAQSETGRTPDWQATDDAVDVQGGDIKIRVANRGTQPAMGVTVTAWWCEWPVNTVPPLWNDGAAGWTPCNPNVSPAQNIDPGDEAEFDFSHAPPADRYVVLAKATCADDLANTDVPLLACSYMKTRLVDLVSGDNNLGLQVLYP